jgi:hypothetical protein
MKLSKNLSILTLSLAGLLGLASCGGTTTSSTTTPVASSSKLTVSTRADAITALGTIAAHTSATGFVAPKAGVITNKVKETSINTNTDSFTFWTAYSADYKNKAGTVLVADGTDIAAYTNDAGEFCVLKIEGMNSSVLTKTLYKDDAAGSLKAIVDASIKAYLAKATYASAFAKYLGNFNDDGSAVTGGTARDATLTKQSYSSTGEGNLTVDITAHYTYDEAITYKWDNYLCVAQKSSDDVTMDWKTQVTTKGFEDEDATAGTIEEGKIVAAYI